MGRHGPIRRAAIPVALAAYVAMMLPIAAGAQPSEGAQLPESGRIDISYDAPADPAHQPVHDLLKRSRVLERVRELLTVFRWPRPLRLELKSCAGESNAFYEDGVVSVCYEYVADVLRAARSPSRPAAVSLEDAFVGPIVDVFMHEAGHAVFDLFKVPVLGREEDAADQFAAYIVLQWPKEKKHRLILGTAFGYASELKVTRPRDLTRLRLRIGRYTSYANEHGTPAQRLFNLLCIAYGSDKELFSEVVSLGYLPGDRAESCEDEYRQVDFAYRTLIAPLVGTGP
ncbi:MAG: DUF4344 domain-containing metallopeptidase [Variibacter sp.]